MEKTTNYKLPRWEKDDFVKMDDFNAAFQTIDETLKAGADAVADEAAARATAVTALQAGGTLCRIACGSYVGSGTMGPTKPVSLTCPFQPLLVVVQSTEQTAKAEKALFLLRGLAQASSCIGSNYHLDVTWAENGVSWTFADQYNSYAAQIQMNTAGVTYHYVIVGC